MKISHFPARVATGAFILNSGLSKLNADDDTAKGLHGMASGTFPMVGTMEPRTFVRTLGMGETVLGGVLLAPFIPSWLAGVALVGFSSGLVRMYLKTPGMTREDGVRPTQQGTAIAKDSWMLGIGLGMILDEISDARGKKRVARRARRETLREVRRRERESRR
jgi:hypothetical protein